MPSRPAERDIETIPLIGGHPVLDFVNTVEDRHSPAETNYLDSPERFVAWAVRLAVIDQPDRHGRPASQKSAAAWSTWRKAMQLRDDVHAILIAVTQDRLPAGAPLQRLGRLAHWASSKSQLEVQDRSIAVRAAPMLRIDERALVNLVHQAMGLLTSGAMARARKCAHQPCDWIFLDQSRNGMRRWCRMEVCGNRSKVRRHRAKRADRPDKTR